MREPTVTLNAFQLDSVDPPTTEAAREAPLDLAAAVEVCSWCPDAAGRTDFYEKRGITVNHGTCLPCRARLRADRLARRARIASAVVLGTPVLAIEDVASIACRIDKQLEAITLDEEIRS